MGHSLVETLERPVAAPAPGVGCFEAERPPEEPDGRIFSMPQEDPRCSAE